MESASVGLGRLPRGRSRIRARGNGTLERALEVDGLEATRPVLERGAVRLQRLDRAPPDHPAGPARGELDPADPGAVLSRAPDRTRDVGVAVRVNDLALEDVDQGVHIRS